MTEEFQNTIKAYLEKRAKEDVLFAKVYKNKNKNIKECCNYIIQEVSKMGTSVALCDEQVYGMAVHYYDEELVSVKTQNSCTVIHTEPIDDDEPMLI